jgi:pyruvate ferredoxin oxidoreductase gamma subunit
VFQIRIHGRGGQGVVTGAGLLSVAAFLEGRHAQAFPSFGSERTGAPVMAFCRIDDRVIRLREPVLNPDALVIQDATLLHQVDLFSGLQGGGMVLLNSPRRLTGADILRAGETRANCAPASLSAPVISHRFAVSRRRCPTPGGEIQSFIPRIRLTPAR